LVAHDRQFDRVAEELSFRHFGHEDAFAFEFDETVTGNGMPVDGQQNVAGL
jgi:hypothetical protein